jgi:hypothetical protein
VFQGQVHDARQFVCGGGYGLWRAEVRFFINDPIRS